MNFFTEVDSTGIVEDHIKGVLRLEDTEARALLENYGAVKDDLIARLARAPGGSFTAQHLRGVLAQVQGGIEALNTQLSGGMIDSAFKAARMGVDNLLSEMKVFDDKFTGAVTPVNINAAVQARDTAQLLVTKYQTNLDAYGNDLYTQIANGLFSATIGEVSYDQVVGRVGRFFSAEEWKLHRIVRTELHGLYNRAKLDSMATLAEEDVPDLMKALMHAMDARTGLDSKYLASLNPIVPIDEPFSYSWGGKLREFMAPPDRPNDRAVMIPYRQEWGAARGSSFIEAKFPAA